MIEALTRENEELTKENTRLRELLAKCQGQGQEPTRRVSAAEHRAPATNRPMRPCCAANSPPTAALTMLSEEDQLAWAMRLSLEAARTATPLCVAQCRSSRRPLSAAHRPPPAACPATSAGAYGGGAAGVGHAAVPRDRRGRRGPTATPLCASACPATSGDAYGEGADGVGQRCVARCSARQRDRPRIQGTREGVPKCGLRDHPRGPVKREWKHRRGPRHSQVDNGRRRRPCVAPATAPDRLDITAILNAASRFNPNAPARSRCSSDPKGTALIGICQNNYKKIIFIQIQK